MAPYSSVLAWRIPGTGCRLWGCTESDTTEGTWEKQQQQNTMNFYVPTSQVAIVNTWHVLSINSHTLLLTNYIKLFLSLIYICAVLCLVTQSCLTLCDPMDDSPPGSSVHGDSPGKNSGVGCHALLLQGIFPTQESNRGLLHWRQIL